MCVNERLGRSSLHDYKPPRPPPPNFSKLQNKKGQFNLIKIIIIDYEFFVYFVYISISISLLLPYTDYYLSNPT